MLGLLHPPELQAQETRVIEIQAIDAPVAEALRLLVARSKIELLYESALVDGRRTTCRIRTQDAVAALRCILDHTGLDYVTLSSGVHVVIGAPERRPELASIVGRVVDAVSGQPVRHAHVQDVSAGTGTLTDEEGRFLLGMVRPGPHPVRITHVAYETRIDTVWTARAARSIPLQQRIVQGQAVLVSGLKARSLEEGTSAVRGLVDDVRALTTGGVGGAARVSGVRVDPGGAGVLLEGSAPGEHGLFLDGTPIFVPLPNGGVFSPFSPLAVRDMMVHRAGSSVRSNSGLAGSIHAEHSLHDGPGGRAAVVQVSPLAADARVSGRRDKWEMMLAARSELGRHLRPNALDRRIRQWSRPDPWLASRLFESDATELEQLGAALQQQPVIMSYADAHAAVKRTVGAAGWLYASAYLGDNRFGTPALESPPFELDAVSDEYVWRNRAFQARYSWLPGTRTLMSAGVWTSSFLLNHPFAESPQAPRGAQGSEFNEVVSEGVYAVLQTSLRPRVSMNLDLRVRNVDTDSRMGVDPRDPTRELLPPETPEARWLAEAALDSDWYLGSAVKVTGGSRLVWVHARRTLYAEPRAAVHLERGRTSGRAAVGLYRQYLNQFDLASWSLSAVLPTFRVWLPLTADQRPATAAHAVLEAAWQGAPDLTVTSRAYRKEFLRLHDVALQSGGPSVGEASGTASGASLEVDWRPGSLEVQGALELSRSRRTVPGRYGGAEIRSPWEQPLRVAGGAIWRPAPAWYLSMSGELVRGRSWGMRRAYYAYLPGEVARPDEDRLPLYAQLDAALSYTMSRSALPVTLRLDAINVTARNNVVEYRLDADGRYAIHGLPRVLICSVRVHL
ncbi:MAG: carboxypeptidase regulatory-like domain-containing protein [Rhodothermales bacterium]|nr:carboxypeptidase regulatory-like domain-containing protein [Rhodothermales bacterium]MBO6778183.1 carboxypeptidase regulatory-like domain-containing protein [Rhodothermales bacterium]